MNSDNNDDNSSSDDCCASVPWISKRIEVGYQCSLSYQRISPQRTEDMANPEHLAKLTQGVKVWNEWRQKNPLVKTDLSNATLLDVDLRDSDLSETNLNGADLSGADMSGADLSNSDLIEANLNGANLFKALLTHSNLGGAVLKSANIVETILSGADLSGVDLTDADLSGAELIRTDLRDAAIIDADMSGANLSLANLSEAELSGSSLEGANLRGAIMVGTDIGEAHCFGTIFADIDLSETVGLEDAEHSGPSTIGIDTIYKSKGKIPIAFLRGAGVSDNLIQYMGSLTGAAFDYYSCFISYSTKGEEFVQRLYADLQMEGVRCWFAPEDLKIGQKFRTGIDEAIRIHDKLLLVLSESSVKSSWVEKEVETAFERERKENKLVLFPVRLDDSVFDTEVAWAADIRRTRHIGDFRYWQNHSDYKVAFERLLRDLKSEERKKEE